jgi:hypothetical protein
MLTVIYKRDSNVMKLTGSSILSILAYFSIFQYPLSKEEIEKYLSPGADPELLDFALKRMRIDEVIYEIDGFYLLVNDPSLVERRKEGNQRAEALLPKAMKIGRFLFRFPFVRGIAISGSLSKLYADEKADIDFFIITKSNRLWLARTFMHLFKKLTFLTGSQHFYCMNYYVDENALTLGEQNIYSAMETITLLPVRGKTIDSFFIANEWVRKWFASYSPEDEDIEVSGTSWTKRALEWLLDNKLGNWLDEGLMNTTTRRWKYKQLRKMRNHEGQEMALITGKHFAKSNPGFFQEKLLLAYYEKMESLKHQWPEHFPAASPAFEKL